MFVFQHMSCHWCVFYFGIILFHIEWSSWLHWTHFYLSESLESLCVDCMLCLTFESINTEPCQYFIIVESTYNKRYHKGLTFIYAPLIFNTWKIFVEYITKFLWHSSIFNIWFRITGDDKSVPFLPALFAFCICKMVLALLTRTLARIQQVLHWSR